MVCSMLGPAYIPYDEGILENKSNVGQAAQFEALTRRFLTAWQLRTPGHLDGVSSTEFRALAMVDAQGQATMSEVARGLGLTLGATTSVVDRLVEAGFAERRHDVEDRRVVKVVLTPQGVNTVKRIVGSMTADMETVLSKIPLADREKFLESYRLIVEAAERQAAG
jgi:DNA-binding MarR family transcriptional regulator